MTNITNTAENPFFEKPKYKASELSQTFWENAKLNIFVVQQCKSCQSTRHYPQYLCSHCLSDSYQWKDIENHGKVHSWTVCHHAFHPGFKADLPYTLVTVDMNEPGVRAMGIWRGKSDLQIGMPAKGQFIETNQGGIELIFS